LQPIPLLSNNSGKTAAEQRGDISRNSGIDSGRLSSGHINGHVKELVGVVSGSVRRDSLAIFVGVESTTA
jgi:hypothetical protein